MIERILARDADLLKLASLSDKHFDLTDDHYDYSKVVVKKPWGYEYLIFSNASAAVWILYLKEGAQTSMHCHPNKKTSLIVLEGEVIGSGLGSEFLKKAGEGLFFDKKVFHQTKAVSPNGAFVMEIETPVNKRDLVRLKDQYGRENLGYEKSDKHSLNIQNYNYLSLDLPPVYHNQIKRFGQCSLNFKIINSEHDLQELFTLADEDSVIVLQGELDFGDSQPALEVAEAISIRDLRQIPQVNFVGRVDVMIIKKIDRVVKISDFIAGFFKTKVRSSVFFVPGDANMHLIDAIGRDETIQYVCCQTENSASLAAEAYAKLHNRPAILVLSSGRSGVQGLAGVANCWVDSTPLLVVSGQARSDQGENGRVRQLGNKSLNIVDIVRSITKYAVRVDDPTLIQDQLFRALSICQTDRPGPVWLDVPIDILGMTLDETELKTEFVESARPLNAATSDYARQTVDLLKQARRPVLLLGNGVRIAGAENELQNVIDRLTVPILLSRRGADLLPDDQVFNFGRPGSFGQRRSNFIIQNCDLLISIGSRLSIPLIGRNSKAFARDAKKVVVDIDPNELSKNTIQIDLPICCDIKNFLEQFYLALEGIELDLESWIDQCRSWSERFPAMERIYRNREFINPHVFINALSKKLPEQQVITIDGGAILHSAMQSFRIKKSQRLITSTGLELSGFSVPAAIGLCANSNLDQVICLTEERGFQISAADLQTVYELRLPIKFFIFNTKTHSSLRNIQEDHFGKRFVGTDCEMVFWNHSLDKIGQIFDIPVFNLLHPKEVDATVQAIIGVKGPAICLVKIDSDQYLNPRTGFTIKDDGKWIAKPLEDMYPFLDKETLTKNMLIKLLAED